MDLRQLRYFVAVAEELHFGRAAVRLHMAQPPLSRSVKQLEAELGCVLLRRTSAGNRLTAAGVTLLREARILLAQADRVSEKVRAVAGQRTFTIGTLGDSLGELEPEVVARFRQSHPHLRVRLRESDLTDPTAGLRAGLVDAAITRLPFDTTGIATLQLRCDSLLAVLPAGDPLALRSEIHLDDLKERTWFQLPEDTDHVWRAYWSGLIDPEDRRDGPVVRTAAECLQSVLWDGTVGVLPAHPAGRQPPAGTALVPLSGMPESSLVVAWPRGTDDQLVHSFVGVVTAKARRAS